MSVNIVGSSDKYALRMADTGSLMLYYKLRNMLTNDGRILPYLTTVLRAMADHTSSYKSQEIKMCGTIYHRLTSEVFLKKYTRTDKAVRNLEVISKIEKKMIHLMIRTVTTLNVI
ncbi:hypothetical protein DPMN_114974 [Dreissena polymorpha]|uniref:Uncharacterized protein n=1 Tax=Dreissena polymorpha TaxID=45954 RepID=A0A9D4KL44_DREPO|nr:hypothetical protein DPMN_114974 [Dreissena polymorpha]